MRASWIISSESHAASVYGSEGRIYGSYVHNRNAVAFRFCVLRVGGLGRHQGAVMITLPTVHPMEQERGLILQYCDVAWLSDSVQLRFGG